MERLKETEFNNPTGLLARSGKKSTDWEQQRGKKLNCFFFLFLSARVHNHSDILEFPFKTLKLLGITLIKNPGH